ncbi:sulfotransferase [Marimonas arenosa]|uniref:Sulfotransferase n=1 Tax=Marimonas arenosa TaxID=1795305 RepID=A0AAE3WG01_9RHOB|nr:sulfotransferase [Marimonas arenosa]MDQ2091949.1 sulfotransferase [Marimonas arenosa]
MSQPDVLATTISLFDHETSRSRAEKTFPIFGLPRGGTTAVAGCIRKLGVFLGDDLPVNLEDPLFSRPAKVNAELVAQRNADHAVWGWKFPNAANYLDHIAKDLRNSRLICVTRDLAANGLAIASRHAGFDDLRALETVFLQTQKNYSLIMRFHRPTLLVSYEKLLLKTEETVREIAGFLGTEVSEAQIEAAVEFVSPGVYRPVTD